MKKCFKKSLIVVLSAILIVISNDSFIQANDYSQREREMNQKCAVINDKETQQECEEYKAYLEQKNASLSSEIDSIRNNLNDVQGDIEAISEEIKKNNDRLAGYEQDIIEIETSMALIETSIVDLNEQIQQKEESVKERDELMRTRLQEMQVYTGSNNFIDFLMGAANFSDLLRRTEILGELNAYENEQIQLLIKERDDLDVAKQSVIDKKELLEVQKANVDGNKAMVEALNETNNEMVAQYQKQESELLADRRAVQMAQASIPTIDTTLISPELDGEVDSSKPSEGDGGSNVTPGDSNTGDSSSGSGSGDSGGSGGSNSGGGSTSPSTSLELPIKSGWYYSAGTWSYPGGGYHLGMDFGTYNATGLPVYAPATGIVIYTYQNCPPTGGYLGNMSGVPSGAGNNLTILVPVNGDVYAISFYHLSSVAVSANQTITQGQVIAYTGNSGNSTGPHCHIEIINVGTMKLSQAVGIFNSKRDLTFGTGWGPDPRACGSAPCRLRPESFWLN